MSNPITVGLSVIGNRIYAGRSKPFNSGNKNARVFTGEKYDVTDEAIYAVAHHLMASGDINIFTLPDGRELHLRADVKEK